MSFFIVLFLLVNGEILTNPIAGVAGRERLIAGLYRLSGRQEREHG
jgi:hypothetical protein